VVFLDAQAGYCKSTESIEFSILHYLNKVLPDLLSVWLLLGILLSLKFNSVIIFSQLSIKSLMRLLNTDTDQVDNSIVENWLSDLPGVLLVMVLFITLNHLKLISVILQVLRLSFQEILFKQKVFFWLLLEIQIQSSFSSLKLFIEMPKLRFQLEISSLPFKKLKSLMKERILQLSDTEIWWEQSKKSEICA